MSTVFAKPGEVRADWYVIDAEGKTLGRLATELAHRLRGKHKADYSPHVDMGDNLIVLNAGKVKVTGNKLQDKFYHHHTGYVGNLKSIALGKLLAEHPERALQFAVKGMLRHRSSQDLHCARLPRAGHRSHHDQRPLARAVLRP